MTCPGNDEFNTTRKERHLDGRAAAASRTHPTSRQTGAESAREIGIPTRQTCPVNNSQNACRAREGLRPSARGAEAFRSDAAATMHSVVFIVPSIAAPPPFEYSICMGTGIHTKADASFADNSLRIRVPRRLPLSVRTGGASGLLPPAGFGYPSSTDRTLPHRLGPAGVRAAGLNSSGCASRSRSAAVCVVPSRQEPILPVTGWH